MARRRSTKRRRASDRIARGVARADPGAMAGGGGGGGEAPGEPRGVQARQGEQISRARGENRRARQSRRRRPFARPHRVPLPARVAPSCPPRVAASPSIRWKHPRSFFASPRRSRRWHPAAGRSDARRLASAPRARGVEAPDHARRVRVRRPRGRPPPENHPRPRPERAREPTPNPEPGTIPNADDDAPRPEPRRPAASRRSTTTNLPRSSPLSSPG